ncbi:hypothetical protein BB8028_0006g07160 [Beauveria bassiana]|uniref:Uncharacterized protein n=1 Tax=Beauveria bassiana TaxID=176275 RepID=A0A2S7YJP8_BEABA|nr:hypothetical protein BB8028_0006g07160 [Beauveria bassiana]
MSIPHRPTGAHCQPLHAPVSLQRGVDSSLQCPSISQTQITLSVLLYIHITLSNLITAYTRAANGGGQWQATNVSISTQSSK